MSFGQMPLANGFLTADEIPNEHFYELAPAVCRTCSLFQIMEQPMPDRMFHSSYPYYTSNSIRMQRHFASYADTVKRLKPSGYVIELGCNDGTMLQHFMTGRHLGIEPAANVAEVARERGCNVINGFFDYEMAQSIECTYGQADAIIAANVICHVADLPDLANGVRHLLKPDGLFIFEEPYLPAMMQRCSFDQIYDEHVFLFSNRSVTEAFSRHGLYLIASQAQWAHGGSMRYYLSQTRPLNLVPVEPTLHEPALYAKLKSAIEQRRLFLCELVRKIRKRGDRIVGYGATSKSTTVAVYCGFGPHEIEYISDTTPIKQGKLSPGAHIPVRPYEEFVKDPPEVALLFAWNHAEEIYAKEKAFKGRWLNYVPAVVLS